MKPVVTPTIPALNLDLDRIETSADALVEEIAHLETALARVQDRAQTALLVEIATLANGLAFDASEIVAAAELRPALATLLQATGLVDARRLGHQLARWEGEVRRGVRVRRLAKVRTGLLWCCDYLGESRSDTCLLDAPDVS